MRHSIRRFMAVLMALTMCFAFSATAFAAEVPEDTVITAESNANAGDEGIMPESINGSISGYAQQTIDKDHNVMYVFCDASGGAVFGSGMGVTVKTSCSTSAYRVTVHGYAKTGTADSFWFGMSTNDERAIGDLTHYNPSCYAIEFTLPDNCPSFLAQVWIYG